MALGGAMREFGDDGVAHDIVERQTLARRIDECEVPKPGERGSGRVCLEHGAQERLRHAPDCRGSLHDPRCLGREPSDER